MLKDSYSNNILIVIVLFIFSDLLNIFVFIVQRLRTGLPGFGALWIYIIFIIIIIII